MARFEKITKIDDNEVIFVTSYSDVEIYRDTTADTYMVWFVQNGQVIFSLNSDSEIDIEEEYRNL